MLPISFSARSRASGVPDEVQALLEEEYELNASETMELQLLEMSLPERFDPREKWPQCRDVFERVYQQGACGSAPPQLPLHIGFWPLESTRNVLQNKKAH